MSGDAFLREREDFIIQQPALPEPPPAQEYRGWLETPAPPPADVLSIETGINGDVVVRTARPAPPALSVARDAEGNVIIRAAA